ncbi:MAG: acetate kinase, partial [Kiritimatiellia bacterium]
MQVLVVNCGSSSIKLAVLNHQTGATVTSARLERVTDHGHALAQSLPRLLGEAGVDVRAVGHRVVHGGARFMAPTRLDDQVVQAIADLSPLAPLHNPHNVAGIRAARELLPNVPHVAVFDTAFHHTLPRRARTYALPRALSEKHGLRRFGFHGPSHAYVAQAAATYLDEDLQSLRI